MLNTRSVAPTEDLGYSKKGQHIHVITKLDEKLVIRPYTPVTDDQDYGCFELIIKVYFKDVHPKFPKGGKMTQHLDGLNIGDIIEVRGPSGLLTYNDKGRFAIRPKKGAPPRHLTVKNIGMIAGGSGVTPMYQLIKHVLIHERNPNIRLSLIFANQQENDILLHEQLDQLAVDYPDQFHIWYTLDRPPPDWKYSSGFINEDMIREHLPPHGADTFILLCGPPPMIDFACKPNLEKLGYEHDLVYPY